MEIDRFELEKHAKITAILLFFKDFFSFLKRMKENTNNENIDEYYAGLVLSSVIWFDLSKDFAKEYLVHPERTEYIDLIDEIKNKIGNEINYDYYHKLIEFTVEQMTKGVKELGYEEY